MEAWPKLRWGKIMPTHKKEIEILDTEETKNKLITLKLKENRNTNHIWLHLTTETHSKRYNAHWLIWSMEMERPPAEARNCRHATPEKDSTTNGGPKEWPWKDEIDNLLEIPKNAHLHTEYRNLLQDDQYSCGYRVLAMAKHTIEYTDKSK